MKQKRITRKKLINIELLKESLDPRTLDIVNYVMEGKSLPELAKKRGVSRQRIYCIAQKFRKSFDLR